ncbi:MAG: thioredoxin domain-containing protein [Parabacteroides sp.]
MKTIRLISLLVFLSTSLFAQQPSLTIEAFEQKISGSGKVQILDARSPEEYAANHLIHALNVNLQDSAATAQLIASLDPSVPTFTYSIREGRSALLAKQLREKGFREVYFMPGGIGSWVGAGFPVESASSAKPSLDEAAYRQLVADHALLLVDISSKYCGSCRKLHPILDELEKNYKELKVLRLELDDNLALTKALQVKSLPSLFLYHNQQKVWEHAGVVTLDELTAEIEKIK